MGFCTPGRGSILQGDVPEEVRHRLLVVDPPDGKVKKNLTLGPGQCYQTFYGRNL